MGVALSLLGSFVVALPADASALPSTSTPSALTRADDHRPWTDVQVPDRFMGRQALLRGVSPEGVLALVETEPPYREMTWFPHDGAPAPVGVRDDAALAGSTAVEAPMTAWDGTWRLVDLASGAVELVPEPLPGERDRLVSVGEDSRLVEEATEEAGIRRLVVERDGVRTPIDGLPLSSRPWGSFQLPSHVHGPVAAVVVPGGGVWLVDTVSAAASPLSPGEASIGFDTLIVGTGAVAWLTEVDGHVGAAVVPVEGARSTGPIVVHRLDEPAPTQGRAFPLSLAVVGDAVHIGVDRRAGTFDGRTRLRTVTAGSTAAPDVGDLVGNVAADGGQGLVVVRPGRGRATTLEHRGPDGGVDVLARLDAVPDGGQPSVGGERLVVSGAGSLWSWQLDGAGPLAEPTRSPVSTQDVATDGVTTAAMGPDGVAALLGDGTLGPVAAGTASLRDLRRAGDGYALARQAEREVTAVVDLGGAAPDARYFSDATDLQGGSTWRSGSEVLRQSPYGMGREWPWAVVQQDLRTGAATVHDVGDGCYATHPQVAGRWLVVRCNAVDEGEPEGLVVDLDGEHPRRHVTDMQGDVVVGDGVAIRAVEVPSRYLEAPKHEVVVQWLDLRDVTAGWQEADRFPLQGRPVRPAVNQSGGTFSAAWYRGDSQVRLLHAPGPASTPRPGPTRRLTAPPPVTGVTTSPASGGAVVRWAHDAPAGAAAEGFAVVATRTSSPGTEHRATARADQRELQLPGLTNGAAYTVQVRALNRTGLAAPVVGPRVVPHGTLPAAPHATELVVDPSTDRATIRWVPGQDPAAAPATGFSVRLGDRVLASNLPAGARSATVQVPKGRHILSVFAHNGGDRSAPDRWGADFPGPDSVVPKVLSTSLATTSLGTSTTYAWTGSDDRKVATYDVRWRGAARPQARPSARGSTRAGGRGVPRRRSRCRSCGRARPAACRYAPATRRATCPGGRPHGAPWSRWTRRT